MWQVECFLVCEASVAGVLTVVGIKHSCKHQHTFLNETILLLTFGEKQIGEKKYLIGRSIFKAELTQLTSYLISYLVSLMFNRSCSTSCCFPGAPVLLLHEEGQQGPVTRPKTHQRKHHIPAPDWFHPIWTQPILSTNNPFPYFQCDQNNMEESVEVQILLSSMSWARI